MNCTFETCFSVLALKPTTPTFPFILAYASSALGWRAWAMGIVAALPHICNFLQPPFSCGWKNENGSTPSCAGDFWAIQSSAFRTVLRDRRKAPADSTFRKSGQSEPG